MHVLYIIIQHELFGISTSMVALVAQNESIMNSDTERVQLYCASA